MSSNELKIVLDTNVFIVSCYRWKLIEADPDDDKFVDCAVAYGADYLVTNDKHFRILENIDFPPVSVISLSGFEKILGQT